MGTQQQLLIVISVIIVGLAIMIGATMFNQTSMNSNRNAVIAESNLIAGNAIAYYRAPVTMGGGGNSWIPEDASGSVEVELRIIGSTKEITTTVLN